MSKLTTRLEKLSFYSEKLESIGTRMETLRANGELPVKQFQTELKTLMDEEAALNTEFNQWMSDEFEFKTGPHTLPLILKTVLEKTVEPTRIIMP
jgi:hypothetical protein